MRIRLDVGFLARQRIDLAMHVHVGADDIVRDGSAALRIGNETWVLSALRDRTARPCSQRRAEDTHGLEVGNELLNLLDADLLELSGKHLARAIVLRWKQRGGRSGKRRRSGTARAELTASMVAMISSLSSKNERYWNGMSTSGLPPKRLCCSALPSPPPPEKALLLIFFLIWAGVSVM